MNDPVSGEEYDVVASFVHEVDGRDFLGKCIARDGKMDVEDGHNHEEITIVGCRWIDEQRWTSRELYA